MLVVLGRSLTYVGRIPSERFNINHQRTKFPSALDFFIFPSHIFAIETDHVGVYTCGNDARYCSATQQPRAAAAAAAGVHPQL